jgi:hypothetical protein
VRVVESAAFAGSALVGGLSAGWTTPRMTYMLTVPFALAAVVAEQIRAALDVLAQVDVESRTSAPSGSPTDR